MLPLRLLVACALAGVAVSLLPAEDKKPADDGFKPMFDGKTLDGWVNVNCHPDTFVAKGGEIVTTGTPTGFLRSDKQYENFVMEFDWMHVEKEKMANSGLFVWGDPLPAVGTGYTRGIEVQVLINFAPKDGWATSHGDIFSIHGAKCTPDRPHPTRKGMERCLPSENRVKGGGEWNHYKVTANDGAIKLEVNGKEVSGVSKCSPRKGYLALESEGAECHFKNLKIKELPSTSPKPEECATVAAGHTSLFNGIDLKGWTTDKDAWKANGGVLRAVGKAELVSEKKYGPCELIVDWKLPAKSSETCRIEVGKTSISMAHSGPCLLSRDFGDGTSAGIGPIKKKDGQWSTDGIVKPGAWNRTVFRVEDTAEAQLNGKGLLGMQFGKLATGTVVFTPVEGLEIMNVFVRELKEKK